MTSAGRMWRRKTDCWPNCRMVIESQCPQKDPLNVNRIHSQHLVTWPLIWTYGASIFWV